MKQVLPETLKIMKKLYMLIALLLPLTATVATAQTVTTNTLTTKTKEARSVYNDIRGRRVHRAATTVLADKDVQRHVRMDKNLQDRLTNPNTVTDLRTASRDIRRNPVKFVDAHEKDIRDLQKHRPKWFRKKTRRHTATKK